MTTSDDRELWVSLDLHNGEYVTSFNGLIEKKVFEDITQNRFKEGFFKLDRVFWFENSEITKSVDSCTDRGISYGYGNVFYLRVEKITGLVPLNREYIESYLRYLER